MWKESDDVQANTLRTLTVLHALRQDWGGALIVSCGLGPQGAALAFAANIAGAVCLSLEPDPDTLRQSLRSGACDFIVNTLDEALRTIKNEVRKHQPLSVGLEGNSAALLQELLDRGVAPELCAELSADLAASHDEALRHFQSQGTTIIGLSPAPRIEGAVNAYALLDALLQQKQWQLASFSFATSSALRAFEAKALTALPTDEALRRKWLQAASKILPREGTHRRLLWLTEEEEHSLQAQLLEPTGAGPKS
ncbi:MAG: hypothetical protein ABI072_06350 [Edaphobacter sp.]